MSLFCLDRGVHLNSLLRFPQSHIPHFNSRVLRILSDRKRPPPSKFTQKYSEDVKKNRIGCGHVKKSNDEETWVVEWNHPVLRCPQESMSHQFFAAHEDPFLAGRPETLGDLEAKDDSVEKHVPRAETAWIAEDDYSNSSQCSPFALRVKQYLQGNFSIRPGSPWRRLLRAS
jgi:hypothetical protein